MLMRLYLLGNLPFFKIHVNHFMAWDNSPWPMLPQNACCGWGAWCHSLSFETFPFGALFLPPSDLCQKLSLSLLYSNTTFLQNSSEWSSLITGPRLNSSPLKAKNPGIFHGSATTFQNEAAGQNWKWCSVLDMSGGESKDHCSKEQYYIGT